MLADVNTYYTEKPLLRSAKLLSLTMAAILFPRAFSHWPFPTGGRQRLLSRQGRFATEIRPAADFMIIAPGTAADLLRAPVES